MSFIFVNLIKLF